MFITKKHISRRTVLRGAGAAIALPLLDAMIPAATALAQTAAKPTPRMGFVYFPHGAIMKAWSPLETGTAYTPSPILAAGPVPLAHDDRRRPAQQGRRVRIRTASWPAPGCPATASATARMTRYDGGPAGRAPFRRDAAAVARADR
jgi:hypothetical protein